MGRKGVLAAAITASLIVASAASSGTVRGLITGLQIKNGSITSADLADGTINSRDLAPSLRQAQSGAFPGRRARRGRRASRLAGGEGRDGGARCPGGGRPAGATGAQGPAGPPQWTVQIDPILPPAAQSNFDTLYFNGSAYNGGYRSGPGNGVQDQSASWKVVLSAGTYSLDVIYVAWNDAGVMTWTLDGAAVGTIDGKLAGGQFNVQATRFDTSS